MSVENIKKQLSEFKNLLGDHSVVDPPDSMPNSEVKRNSADGSVGLPHVRVGHRRLNAGGRPNTCKSSGNELSEPSGNDKGVERRTGE